MAKYILRIEMEFDDQTKLLPTPTQLVSAVQAAEFWLPGKCLTWGLSETTNRNFTGIKTIKDLPTGDFRTK